MWRRSYFTLVASLPPLPHFERAKTLPINPERLEARLRMLDPDDAESAAMALDFLRWQSQPMGRTDAEIVARYARIMDQARDPDLRELVDSRMQLRTVVAALRRRRLGQPPPRRSEAWGVGPFVPRIEAHWQEPDFGLAGVYPWLPEVRRHLEAGETLEVQRLLMDAVWQHLSALESGQTFTFERVLIYLFKWDIVRRWLTYACEAAAQRFEHLLREALVDHSPVFA